MIKKKTHKIAARPLAMFNKANTLARCGLQLCCIRGVVQWVERHRGWQGR